MSGSGPVVEVEFHSGVVRKYSCDSGQYLECILMKKLIAPLGLGVT